MADFFNSISGFNANAKDLIKAENKTMSDEDEKEYDASYEFDGVEGESNDSFSINDVDEYQYDYTTGDAEPEEEPVQENPFL